MAMSGYCVKKNNIHILVDLVIVDPIRANLVLRDIFS
jgi:hypothetical protein